MNLKLLNISIFALFTVISQTFQVNAEPVTEKNINIQCGKYLWTITCGHAEYEFEDSRACNKNKITLINAQKEVKAIHDPESTKKYYNDKRPLMIEGTTATGLSCLLKSEKYYVSAYYTDGRAGTGKFYEWFNSDGSRLTIAGILINKKSEKPNEGLSWKQLPKFVYIEEDIQ